MKPVVDLILHSGQVHAMDPGLGVVQAVAISGSRIVAAGNDEELATLAGPGVRTVNLDSRGGYLVSSTPIYM